MRATDDGTSYEFIFIGNDMYFRSGDKTWNPAIKIIDSDDPNGVSVSNNHLRAKDFELYVEDGKLKLLSGGKKYSVALTEEK